MCKQNILHNKRNIILSRKNVSYKNCEVFSNIDAALKALENEVMVIGGDNIYKQISPLVHKLYITQVNAHIKAGAFFQYGMKIYMPPS